MRICFHANLLLFTFLLSAGIILFFSGCKVKPSPDSKKEQQNEVNNYSNKGTVDPEKNAGEKLGNDAGNLPFSLLESFSQEWTSGISGGGRSTEYSFRLIINTADKIDFDSAWISGNAFKVYLANTSKVISNRPVIVAQNDTATVRVSHSSNAKPSSVAAPLQYKGAALISYRLNGNTHYYEILSIEKKPAIHGQ